MATPQTEAAPGGGGPASSSSPAPAAAAAAGGEPSDDEGFITNLTPNDVLCGRGSGPNDHSGNVKFRQLVLSRKAEYLSTSARQVKARIAQEIVDHVKTNMVPPGRFLKKVDQESATEAGFPRGAEVWVLVKEDVALEKAKQALRQNRDKHLVAEELAQCQAAAAAAAAAGGGGGGGAAGGPVKPQPRKIGDMPPPHTGSDGYHPHAVSPPSSGASMPYVTPTPPHVDPYCHGASPYAGNPYGRGGDPYYGGPPPGGGGYGDYAADYATDYASMPPPSGPPGSYPPPPQASSMPGSMPPPSPHDLAGPPPHSSAPPGMGPPSPGMGPPSPGMGPPSPGMLRSNGSGGSGRQARPGNLRESLTVADLERDFRSRAHVRPHRDGYGGPGPGAGGPGGGYSSGGQPPPRPQYQDAAARAPQDHHHHRSSRGAGPAAHALAPAALPEDAELVEQFPYALGGRGPSAETMPDVGDPLPASRSQGGAGASDARLSGRTMEFIASAFDESGSIAVSGGSAGVGGTSGGGPGDGKRRGSARGMAQRQRQYQMMGRAAAAANAAAGGGGGGGGGAGVISDAASPPAARDDPPAVAVKFEDDALSPSPTETELDRRRLSTMSDISAMSMSLSLTDMNMSKELSKWVKSNEAGQGGAAAQGGGVAAARPEAIKEGDESSSTLGGKGASVGSGEGGAGGGGGEGGGRPTPDRTASLGSAEPRRISTIRKEPSSVDEFGMSSMSIMKGLQGMESSSTFSAMSVLMSESDVESSKERVAGGTGHSESLSS